MAAVMDSDDLMRAVTRKAQFGDVRVFASVTRAVVFEGPKALSTDVDKALGYVANLPGEATLIRTEDLSDLGLVQAFVFDRELVEAELVIEMLDQDITSIAPDVHAPKGINLSDVRWFW